MEEWMYDSDFEALAYLKTHGVNEVANGIFIAPGRDSDWDGSVWEAVNYLCWEWDFCVVSSEEAAKDLSGRLKKPI